MMIKDLKDINHLFSQKEQDIKIITINGVIT